MAVKDIIIELLTGFFALLILLNLLGKIQFSQITPFDFISGMVMGNFVGDAVFDDAAGIKEILLTISVWGLLIYLVELATQKSPYLRAKFEGTPSILINKGEILYKNLKKNKIDFHQLQQLMRNQGYFSLFEAEYVVLERDGQISIAPKHKYGAPTKEDLQIPEKKVSIPAAFIMDGKVFGANLREAGLDESWLKDQLAQKKIHSYKDVMYAEWTEDSGLTISKYSS
ncbi:DUF421 domain-containing protein [Peribacillus sp. SCS-37]|uniref:DUF421 domain-containing protein n=1 Tax=Paraperibacillus esterisolvens TaxID=3115296 RepID=UPI003906058B